MRSRSELDHLLEATLHGTITLEEVNHTSLPVGEDLRFDVSDIRHCFFEKDGRVAEGALCFTASSIDRTDKICWIIDSAKASSSTTGGCLHEDREADLGGELERVRWVLDRGRLLEDGQVGRKRSFASAHLVARQFEDTR